MRGLSPRADMSENSPASGTRLERFSYDDDVVRKETMTRLWREVDRLSPQQRAAQRSRLPRLNRKQSALPCVASKPR